MKLNELEQENGRLAASLVARAGGAVTFREYDLLMEKKLYIGPINWIGVKADNDKLCAFAAVAMGLLRRTESGYERIHQQAVETRG